MQEHVVRIEGILAEKDKAALARLDESQQLDWSELVAAQGAQSQAFAGGRITESQAMWLYRVFGGEVPTPEKFAKQALAVRVVAIKALGELVKAQVATATA